jgi:hypothetical protein
MVITAARAVRTELAAGRQARHAARDAAHKRANEGTFGFAAASNIRQKCASCRTAHGANGCIAATVLRTARKRCCDEKKNEDFPHDGLPRNSVVMSPDSSAHAIETKGKIP